MNAATAPPKSRRRRRLEHRVGDHVAHRLLPGRVRAARGVATGANVRRDRCRRRGSRAALRASVYFVRIVVSAGSFATSCVTIAVGRRRRADVPSRVSIRRSISVITRPNEAALVTSLPVPSKFGHTYGCVRVRADDRRRRGVEPVQRRLHVGTAEVDAPVDVRVRVRVRRRRVRGRRGGFWKPPWWRSTTNAFDALLASELCARAR